jgi:hypothetical protein
MKPEVKPLIWKESYYTNGSKYFYVNTPIGNYRIDKDQAYLTTIKDSLTTISDAPFIDVETAKNFVWTIYRNTIQTLLQ